MKRITFGTPEAIVPSRFCKTFHAEETPVSYDTSKIRFRRNARGCVLEIPVSPDEHFYGLGLQLKQLDWKGRHARLKVNADPIAPTGDSHAPVPFFVSTAGYGIYLDTARYVEIDFGRTEKGSDAVKESAYEVQTTTDALYAVRDTDTQSLIVIQIPAASGIDLYLFEGKTITEIVSRYNLLAGGGCRVPDWGFGFFFRCYGKYTQEEVLAAGNYFLEKDIPCSIIGIEPGWQTRSYSCSHVWNRERFPDPAAMLQTLYGQGYHVNLWEHAFLHPESPIHEEIKPYSGNYTVWNGLVPDFSLPEARKLFVRHHKTEVAFDLVDGYKLDECDSSDYTGGWSFPDSTEFPSGMDGEQYHSLFGTLYMQTMMEAMDGKETYSEVRNAGALNAPYPFVLYSDLYDHTDFVRGIVTSGFSGLLWSPEVRRTNTKEEFLRRMQTVVFSSQCLINGWNYEIMPWLKFDCEDELRALVKVREGLRPMLKKAFEAYEKTGRAPIRALVSDWTSDPETYTIDDEYLFCDRLVVAPILAGKSGRRVYLPAGKWHNYFTGEPQESGWFEVETDGIPVYEKED